MAEVGTLSRGSGGVLATLTAAVLVTGCGLGDPASPPTPSRAAATTATVPSVPAVTAEEPAPPPAPGETDAAGLVVPETTAGDLAERNVPRAPDLGRGWARFVDPGDVAEGYTGNGAWVRARGAAEVVQAVVPLGCAGLDSPPDLPVPEHALEATYRGPGDAPGVALVLDYASQRQASRFLAGMATIASTCRAPAGNVGADDPLTVVVDPVRITAATVLDRRRELGAGASEWLWSEVVVREGSRVGLLILASPPSGRQPDLGALAKRLRATVPR